MLINSFYSYERTHIEKHGNPERETLNLILTNDGKKYYIDSKKNYWRAYIFIEDAVSYDAVENPDDFYQTRLHSETSKDFLQIFRRILFMKRLKASMIHKKDSIYLKR